MRRIIFVLMLIIAISTSSVFVYADDSKEVANLSGYGFASSDSYDGENTLAFAAIDGDVLELSRWKPAVNVRLNNETGVYDNMRGKTAWLRIEFEIPTEISSAKIYWAKERAAEGYYMLQYSDDGENWTDVKNFKATRNDGDGSVNNPCIDDISFDTVKAKNFRVEIKAGISKEGMGSIYEFQLFGDPSQYDFVKKDKKVENNDSGNTSEAVSESSENSFLSYTLLIVVTIVVILIIGIVMVVSIIKKKQRGMMGDE